MFGFNKVSVAHLNELYAAAVNHVSLMELQLEMTDTEKCDAQMLDRMKTSITGTNKLANMIAEQGRGMTKTSFAAFVKCLQQETQILTIAISYRNRGYVANF